MYGACQMEPLHHASGSFTFTSWMLLLLLRIHQSLEAPPIVEAVEAAVDGRDPLSEMVHAFDSPHSDYASLISSALHNFRLCTPFSYLDDDLGYWVKPRSTTWFSRFLVDQYDNTRWVEMFRMTKPSVFALAGVLRPHVEKQDTKFRLAIPVLIRVACTLFKLTHAANFTVCSEMFAIGRSTVSKAIREVVHAINESLRHEILWPSGERLQEKQAKFLNFVACLG